MMWGYYYGPAGAGMAWWMALSALFWVALIAAIIWGVVRLAGGRGAFGRRSAFQAPPVPTAEEILRERYARGEIDAQTFEAMRERLAGASAREPATPLT